MILRLAAVPLLLACALTCAAEQTPPTPAPAPTPASAAAPADAQKPFLGIQVDPTKENSFDGGIVVSAVMPNSTAQAMGIQAGDVLLSINQKKMTKMDDLQAVIGAAKVGDVATIEFTRKGEKLTKSGPLQARPAPPKPTVVALNDLQKQVEQLKARKDREPTLPEMLDDIVTQLNALEKHLPKAAEAFKKQYPNGEFDISITIKISSDKTATNPVELGKPADDGAKKDVPASPDGAVAPADKDAKAVADPAKPAPGPQAVPASEPPKTR
ncbi:MAG: PDZ domain-containing protein [Planctomycetes bacterium]|nr:PDZ domain-containing protein [Planctomycetota bacterium]